MSRCAAIIQIGWIVDCFEGKDPCGIIAKVEEVQNFGCLLDMGRMEGEPEDQKALDALEEFLDKYYEDELTMDDIKNLDIHLSIGDLSCHGIATTESEIKALKNKKKK